MTRSIEEQLRTAQQKVNRLKTQVATKQKAEQRAKRKERDHKKYVLAGNILKVLNMSVEESEKHMNMILGKVAELNNIEPEKLGYVVRKGDRILEAWSKEEQEDKTE